MVLSFNRRTREATARVGFPGDFADTFASSPYQLELTPEIISNALPKDAAPLPPAELRENYHGERHGDYWLSGLSDFERVMRDWRDLYPARELRSILEFGSSSGRVLRHFSAQFSASRCYGCDLGISTVEWIIENLNPNVVAFQNTLVPHLPLPDQSMDIICAFSVFTHIDTYELAWLSEMARILKPEGLAFFTIASDEAWEASMRQDWRYASAIKNTIGFDTFPRDEPMPRRTGKLFFPNSSGDYGNAFHTRVMHFTLASTSSEFGGAFSMLSPSEVRKAV